VAVAVTLARNVRAQDPALNPEAEAFKERTALRARLATAQLVPALNEQLAERAAGNAAYRAGRFDAALESYERALAILDFVQGVSAADQAEVNANKGTVLWNMAAAHLGRHEHGAAVAKCTQALALPGVDGPQQVRLLLRRATAHTRRHDYAAAQADLDAVKEMEPWNEDAEEAEQRLRRLRAQDAGKDRAFAAAALRA
jgi:FK506-binding protein 4/5